MKDNIKTRTSRRTKKIEVVTKPQSKPEVPKEEEKKKTYWWHKEKEEQQEKMQFYHDSFFIPYRAQLEIDLDSIPEDPIYLEEREILHTSTEKWKDAGPGNPNIPELFKFYEKEVMPSLEKTLVSVLIPTGDGNSNLNCMVAFSGMFKTRHRVHTVQGHNIGVLRNMLVDMALQHEDTTHVFFVDSDTIIPPFGLIRMLRRDLDIVAGIYTMKAPPYTPLAIKRPRDKNGDRMFNYYFRVRQEHLKRVVPCDGTGGGALLIKKDVLEKMGPPWFQVTPKDNGLSATGEDLFFFDKAMDMGYQPFLDLTIQCEHAIGGTSYPRLFLQKYANIGIASAIMVDRWNKNAILQSLGLPLFKPPEEEQPISPTAMTTTEPIVAPPTSSDDTSMPVGIEGEKIKDARSDN